MRASVRLQKKAQVDQSACVACGCCAKVCPLNAIRIHWGLYAQVEQARCVGCGRCVAECPGTLVRLVEVAP